MIQHLLGAIASILLYSNDFSTSVTTGCSGAVLTAVMDHTLSTPRTGGQSPIEYGMFPYRGQLPKV